MKRQRRLHRCWWRLLEMEKQIIEVGDRFAKINVIKFMSPRTRCRVDIVDIRCWHMWSWWPIMNNFVIKNSACTASRSSARPLPVHLLQSCGRETPHLGVFSIPQPGNRWLQWDLNHRRGCQNWPLNRGGTRAQSKINLFLLNCWVLLSCVGCMPNWYIVADY